MRHARHASVTALDTLIAGSPRRKFGAQEYRRRAFKPTDSALDGWILAILFPFAGDHAEDVRHEVKQNEPKVL